MVLSPTRIFSVSAKQRTNSLDLRSPYPLARGLGFFGSIVFAPSDQGVGVDTGDKQSQKSGLVLGVVHTKIATRLLSDASPRNSIM